MRPRIVPDAKQFQQYYLRGQNGGSISGFQGARIQRGYGIGNFFKSIARVAIPLVKRGAQAIAHRALGAAVDVGHDMMAGKSFKQAAKARGREAFGDIAQQGIKRLKNQSGGGRKRKAPIKTATKSKPASKSQAKKQKTSQVRTPFPQRS